SLRVKLKLAGGRAAATATGPPNSSPTSPRNDPMRSMAPDSIRAPARARIRRGRGTAFRGFSVEAPRSLLLRARRLRVGGARIHGLGGRTSLRTAIAHRRRSRRDARRFRPEAL